MPANGRWNLIRRLKVKAIGWEVVNWVHLSHDADVWRAVVRTVVNLQIPSSAGNL